MVKKGADLERTDDMKLHIKAVRLSKHMSLNELARQTNISISYLSDLENGKRINVSIVKLCKIAHILGVKVTELFDCT